MTLDRGAMAEGAVLVKSLMSDEDVRRLEQARSLGLPLWVGRARVEKRLGNWTPEQIVNGDAPAPYEVVEGSPQLLLYGGASCLWEALIGNGTGTAGQALTFFNNGNAAIGVGDSSTVAAATQTDLQASSNKLRKGMDSTYPQHTDGVISGAASIVFQATFGSSEGNYAWNEWCLFNSATLATGRALNRKAESLGTKAAGSTWSIQISLSLS